MYDDDKDHSLLVDWCNAHGAEPTPASLLPPLGVVVQMNGEDAAMLFLYYALSAGVAFVDAAATRPKLSAKQAIDCFGCALEFLKAEARQDGYAVIMANVSKPMSRCLSRLGFYTQEEGMVRMFMPASAD